MSAGISYGPEYLGGPDGSGYPHGWKAAQIPLEAHIVRVADVFSSLVERRPYKPPLELAAAMQMLATMAGTKLEPQSVEALQQLVDGNASLGTTELLADMEHALPQIGQRDKGKRN